MFLWNEEHKLLKINAEHVPTRFCAFQGVDYSPFWTQSGLRMRNGVGGFPAIRNQEYSGSEFHSPVVVCVLFGSKSNSGETLGY